MITMDVKGMRWVGNMYQKFENMFLEAEDVMYEDTVKYIENQMQAVGESVKKFYSDIVEDLLESDEEVGIELPIDKHADARFYKKPFQVYKERHVKADTKQTTEDLRIHNGVDNYAKLFASFDRTSEADASTSLRNSVKQSNFSSPSRQYAGRMDVNSNIGIDENPVRKEVAATKIIKETTLAEANTCTTLQSCEISSENQNQNHGVSVSKPASTEVTNLAPETDCSNEIENASTEQFPNVQELDKSAEEKQIDASSSCCVPFAESVDHMKLEEACVMVSRDEIQLPPKAGGNANINKKKTRRAFSLYKKSARKQEYKELAAWHLKSEKVNEDCMENLNQTLPHDPKKPLLSSMTEPEWELL
ncbi:uncharacterized protein LOC109799032 isoform X2 [Cajanus cajan]|uniref:uncharacterized protein LOC109799032 isoform X2 n=1 Tax=Cajanus cajan TaxID=3821 RepID=UPI00098DC19E|nr:uncharacterized protein LOC109799032 isoform X2 [Cajanus cajan]